MKCPLTLNAPFMAGRVPVSREGLECLQEKCAWWVTLIKPGPRGELGACAIHYLGIFGIEKAGVAPSGSPLP